MAENYAANDYYAERNAIVKHLRATTNLSYAAIGKHLGMSGAAAAMVCGNPNATITRLGGVLRPHNILLNNDDVLVTAFFPRADIPAPEAITKTPVATS